MALCKMLLEKPDLLLLDEPTNHLDAESVAWLERHLAEYTGTVVAVTHDRYFLDNVAGWILELDRGRGIPWEGNYSSWLEQKQDRLAQRREGGLGPAKDPGPRAGMDSHGPARPAGQEQGPHRGLRADVGRGARGCARGGDRDADPARQAPGRRWWSRLKNVSKAYGDRLLIEDLNFRLPPGGIVGVIGPNGAGKTTLFRMIVGQEKPDEGTVRVGADGRTGLCRSEPRRARARATPSSRRSPAATTISMLGKRKIRPGRTSPRSISRGPDQQKQVGKLSGGERNRVHLAKLLRRGAQRAAAGRTDQRPGRRYAAGAGRGDLNFAGCAVVISHDRWFLDRVATHILAFEGDSYVHWCEGNFQTYEEQRAAPGHRSRPAAPHPLQEAAALSFVSKRR